MRSEKKIKRIEARPGDLIFYVYRFYSLGMSQQGRDTRRVTQVINEGAAFYVEGGFRINATQVISVIQMSERAEQHA